MVLWRFHDFNNTFLLLWSGKIFGMSSNLQLPSLIPVVGFFIRGVLVNHFILPLLF